MAPSLGRVIRASSTDFYFNSLRLIPANLLWGAGVLAVGLVWLVWPVGALLASPLMALPTVGVFRVAAGIVRNEPDVSFRDVLAAYRHHALPAVPLGLGFVAAGLILGTNFVTGLTQAEFGGWIIGTLAGWGLFIMWCLALIGWPLLVDPFRVDRPARERLRLAGLLLIAYPVRFAALGVVAAVVVVVSTILTAALLTIGVAFVALVACRYVYPAADRLESRLAGERR